MSVLLCGLCHLYLIEALQPLDAERALGHTLIGHASHLIHLLLLRVAVALLRSSASLLIVAKPHPLVHLVFPANPKESFLGHLQVPIFRLYVLLTQLGGVNTERVNFAAKRTKYP